MPKVESIFITSEKNKTFLNVGGAKYNITNYDVDLNDFLTFYNQEFNNADIINYCETYECTPKTAKILIYLGF